MRSTEHVGFAHVHFSYVVFHLGSCEKLCLSFDLEIIGRIYYLIARIGLKNTNFRCIPSLII